MNATAPCTKPLAKGQVWKTRAARIEIVALGETLLQYRVTDEMARRVSSQLSGIEAMQNYLQTNGARLATGAN
jgi:hypothetical protein